MSQKKITITKELRRVDSFRWTSWLLFDWALIIGCIVAAVHSQHWGAWVAAIIVIGNRQHALGILVHDAAHYMAYRNRFINDLVANCLGAWTICWTVEGYRVWHLKHHRHTGKKEDPELDLKKLASPFWDLPVGKFRFFLEFVMDICGRGIVGFLTGFLLLPPPRKRQLIGAFVFPITVSGILIAAGMWKAVALWYISFATTFTLFNRMRMWIEHVGSNDTHRVHLTFIEALLLAPHNTWYHWEHHEYPIVPFHKLPEIRKLDTRVKVISLQELIQLLITSNPIPSGDVPGNSESVEKKTQSVSKRLEKDLVEVG